MSGFSTYLSRAIISATLGGSGGAAYTPVATLYLALFTGDPTDNNVTTKEVSTGTWYVRKPTGS